MTGRPSKRTPALVDAILASMHEGESLRSSCTANGVAAGTFMGWMDEDKALSERYARAREAMLDRQAEELEEIGKRAAAATTAVEVNGLRLLSDNRKWLLSKLAHKKYGDKIDMNHSGGVTIIASPLDEKL